MNLIIKKYCLLLTLFYSVVCFAQQNNYFRYFSGDELSSFEPTKDGGCIVNCFSSNYLVTKIDSTGHTEWTYVNNQSNGQDSINGFSIVRQTLDGGYIGVGGLTPHGNDFDMIAVKFDNSGNVEWRKSFDVYIFDVFSDVFIESDTTYLATGSFQSATTAFNFVAKLNKFGDTLWTKKYSINALNFSQSEGIFKINNFYYLFGTGNDTINNFEVQRIIKYDTLGNLISIYTLNDSASLALKGGKFFSDNDSSLFSYVKMKTSAGIFYYQINEFDLNGNKRSSHLTSLTDASFDSDTTILGIEQSFIPQDSIFVLGENFNLNVRTKYGYLFQDNNNPNEYKYFKRDKYGNILIGGSYDPNGFGQHPFIARFVDTSATIGFSNIEKSDESFLIFPNPANLKFVIKVSSDFIRNGNSYSFKIYNEEGKEFIRCNQIIKSEYDIDLTNFPKGFYFIRIDSSNKKAKIKKIIVN